MKRFALLFFLFCALLYSKSLSWRGDYDKALIEARDSDKVLLVLLVKNGCKKCNEVLKKVFTDQPYIKSLNQKVIAVLINKDYKNSYPIEMYYTTIYPTLFFVNPQNETFIKEPIYKNITKDDLNSLFMFLHTKP